MTVVKCHTSTATFLGRCADIVLILFRRRLEAQFGGGFLADEGLPQQHGLDLIPQNGECRIFSHTFFSLAGLIEANGFFALIADGFGVERA